MAAPLRYDMMLPACAMTVVGVWFLDVTDDRIILLLAIAVASFLALLVFNPRSSWMASSGRSARLYQHGRRFRTGGGRRIWTMFSALIMSFRLPKGVRIL